MREERETTYYSSGVAVDEDAMAGSRMGLCAVRDCFFFGVLSGCLADFFVRDRRPREKSVLWSES
jgi:hypothetical protein